MKALSSLRRNGIREKRGSVAVENVQRLPDAKKERLQALRHPRIRHGRSNAGFGTNDDKEVPLSCAKGLLLCQNAKIDHLDASE